MEKKTNGMSIAAIIFTFLIPVVGLILAILAKKKNPDDTLAKVSFVISLIFVILGVLGTACYAAILAPAMFNYVEKANSYISLLAL